MTVIPLGLAESPKVQQVQGGIHNQSANLVQI